MSSALYAVAFVGLSGSLGVLAANLVAMMGSTLLANELHRRLTFRATVEVGWLRAQLQGGGLAAVGLIATSLALVALDAAIPSARWLIQVLILGAVSGAIGLVRFVALRALVFPSARPPAPGRRGSKSSRTASARRGRSWVAAHQRALAVLLIVKGFPAWMT